METSAADTSHPSTEQGETKAETPAEAAGHPQNAPDLSQLTGTLRGSVRVIAIASGGLFLLALFYTLYAGAAFFMPVVVALLFDFLLNPVVSALKRFRIPTPLGAGLVMLALLGATALGLYYLSGPASTWLDTAPQKLRRVESKLRGLPVPVEEVRNTTEQVEEIAKGQGPQSEGSTQQEEEEGTSMTDTIMGQTREFLAGTAIAIFLLYFLLASGNLFMRKLVRMLPRLRRQRKAVRIARRVEEDLSTYLFTYAIINTTLASLIAVYLYLLGMPNPILWGIVAGVMNFIPYLGPLVSHTIIGLVAFTSLESTGLALAATFGSFGINALEGSLITPMVMGQQLRLNPVAIFVSLTFWGWIWGIAGALLAVPMLVAFKIVCDNIATLQPVGEFLGR